MRFYTLKLQSSQNLKYHYWFKTILNVHKNVSYNIVQQTIKLKFQLYIISAKSGELNIEFQNRVIFSLSTNKCRFSKQRDLPFFDATSLRRFFELIGFLLDTCISHIEDVRNCAFEALITWISSLFVKNNGFACSSLFVTNEK